MGLHAQEPAELNGFRILIIDDQADAREALSTLLESLGAQVQSAENAQQGLAALARYQPDVVLCDIAMPGEDGFSLIRKVRALERRQSGKVPMVAVTAYAERENIQRCLDAGFDAHLAKPMDVVDLAGLIAELGRRRKPARRARSQSDRVIPR
jgi:CheY-like chemotaxis protein